MSALTLESMRGYLGRSIASLNRNKLNGLLAEVDFRRHLASLGLQARVSPGGWIARRVGPGTFGHATVVLFPETIRPGVDYGRSRPAPRPSHGLHTICSTFHQSGIHAFFTAGEVSRPDDPLSLTWRSVQLGLPVEQPYELFPESLDVEGFSLRTRRQSFLHYKTDARSIPDEAVPDEFSKESLRVSFQERFLSEISDVDGIFWGKQFTYPLEIKEKTAASDGKLGEYFGLDIGPFVKLAFYAAKRGNLHSLFVVREIDAPDSRELVSWWFITFDQLALFASWVSVAGGPNMLGGRSAVVKVPRAEFRKVNRPNFEAL